MVLNEKPLIDGIGNEVVIFATAFIGIAITVLFIIIKRCRSVYYQRIHPSNESVVNETREHLTHLFSNRFVRNSNTSNTIDDNNDMNLVNSNHYGMDNQCPVCLNEPRFPIETNCGHLFCAQCLIVYWQHGQWRGGPIKCPVCRQQVSVMLQCFQPNTVLSDEESSERSRIMHDVNDYNRRYSGAPRPLMDYIYDLPTLLRHLTSEFFTVGGLMYMFRIRIVLCFVAAIMYLISPLDMIPEAVFGLFGLLDDIFVVLLLAIYVTIIYRRFLSRRWEEEPQ
ncbi:E3 ubiquitin-protein ligase RNF170-like [Oppia nitens]|uniref:E3 ubiquitin-protein ligase RNF170-like n=1 Tax=Oppia nitens TaxID=1686743 RepID=UPI0023DB00E3|nr:E3 ubiquitin-protein ligase RNF170-like [Oppia nitens]